MSPSLDRPRATLERLWSALRNEEFERGRLRALTAHRAAVLQRMRADGCTVSELRGALQDGLDLAEEMTAGALASRQRLHAARVPCWWLLFRPSAALALWRAKRQAVANTVELERMADAMRASCQEVADESRVSVPLVHGCRP